MRPASLAACTSGGTLICRVFIERQPCSGWLSRCSSSSFLRSPAPRWTPASLRALIADQSGAVVPGATVTLTNAATGVAQSLVSDTEGYVAFTPIQRGNYSLRVELSGFRTREIKAITVDVNERKFLRVALDTGGRRPKRSRSRPVSERCRPKMDRSARSSAATSPRSCRWPDVATPNSPCSCPARRRAR